MKTKQADLSKLSATFTSLEQNLDKVKASMCCDTPVANHQYLYDAVSYCQSCLYDLKELTSTLKWQVEYLSEWRDDHNIGHLPKITSKEQMDRAIAALGLEAEYETARKVVFANERNQTVARIG